MDVHKEAITIAVLPNEARAPTRLDRLPNDLPKLRRYLERLAQGGDLRACYEASGAGYVIHRAMREWGYACDVIAPSLVPKRPGVQRKHDKRDAADLSRLYRAGELTAVRIPSETDERVRDVVRCRETVEPFLFVRRLSAEAEALFSETGYAAKPERAAERLVTLLSGPATAVCSQGKVIPALLQRVCAQLSARAVWDGTVAKGGFVVLNIAGEQKSPVASVDRYRPVA